MKLAELRKILADDAKGWFKKWRRDSETVAKVKNYMGGYKDKSDDYTLSSADIYNLIALLPDNTDTVSYRIKIALKGNDVLEAWQNRMTTKRLSLGLLAQYGFLDDETAHFVHKNDMTLVYEMLTALKDKGELAHSGGLIQELVHKPLELFFCHRILMGLMRADLLKVPLVQAYWQIISSKPQIIHIFDYLDWPMSSAEELGRVVDLSDKKLERFTDILYRIGQHRAVTREDFETLFERLTFKLPDVVESQVIKHKGSQKNERTEVQLNDGAYTFYMGKTSLSSGHYSKIKRGYPKKENSTAAVVVKSFLGPEEVDGAIERQAQLEYQINRYFYPGKPVYFYRGKNNRPKVVIPYHPGKPLDEVSPSTLTAIPFKERICYLCEFLEKYVDKLHASQVIHVDIKPENCLWDKTNGLRLFDFAGSFKIGSKKPYAYTEKYSARCYTDEKPPTFEDDMQAVAYIVQTFFPELYRRTSRVDKAEFYLHKARLTIEETAVVTWVQAMCKSCISKEALKYGQEVLKNFEHLGTRLTEITEKTLNPKYYTTEAGLRLKM